MARGEPDHFRQPARSIRRPARKGEGRRRAAAARALALATVVTCLGCETAQQAGETVAFELNPFGSTETLVIDIEVHGPYLLADLRGRQIDLRFLAPRTETCAAVLAPEARLRYLKHGVFGRFLRDDEQCDAAGVMSLAAWRDRNPRTGGGVVPRATVRYGVVFRDDDFIFLRGRFPLTARIGIPAGYDLVAVLPNAAPCTTLAERREASMEFRPAGRAPYRILAGDGVCEVAGFATPVAGLPPR